MDAGDLRVLVALGVPERHLMHQATYTLALSFATFLVVALFTGARLSHAPPAATVTLVCF